MYLKSLDFEEDKGRGCKICGVYVCDNHIYCKECAEYLINNQIKECE